LQALNQPPDSEVRIANGESGCHKLDQLEICTRSHLLELVERLLLGQEQQGRQTPTDSDIEILLNYLKNATLLCLHVAHHHQNNSPLYSHIPSTACIKKLPFILLEDAIDSLPLNHIQSLWASPHFPTQCISSYTSTLLCSPLIFVTPSKFVLLRICNKLLKILSNRDVDAEFAGSVMMMMANVFPLSERSAVNVLGSFNVKNETLLEDEKEFANKAMDGRGNDHSNSIGYDFYKTFWGVQKVFTNPQGTILPSRGGPSQAAATTAHSEFMKDITSILVALESTPTSKLSNTTSCMPQPGNTSTANVVRHHKYLTSSQLLHLQLKDAKLRVHFLTQLIIIVCYLDSPMVMLPTLNNMATPGSDPLKLHAQINSTQVKQLAKVKSRSLELLQATSPPLGESLVRSLQWLLHERESIWRNWKRNKCLPAMDKVGPSTISGISVKNKLSGKKRMAEDSDNGRMEDTGDIPKLACLPKSSPPMLISFLEPYVEALDPENGIEGEYHPRNDSVYSWRALRLMARDQAEEGQLWRFGKVRKKDGDFEGIVRDMWKGEIGGELIETYYDEAAAEKIANGDISKKDVDVLDMDDAASVGTPEEAVETKKEKMAEFEKAAMEVEKEMMNDEVLEDSSAKKMDALKNGAGVVTEEGKGEKRHLNEESRKQKVNCPIHVAAAETIESMFSEEPEKRTATKLIPKKVDSNEPKKNESTAVRNEQEPESLNNRPSVSEATLNTSNVTSKETANTDGGGGKKQYKLATVDLKAKAPQAATVKLASTPTVDSAGKQEDHKPARVKFTPPIQKLQAQQPVTKRETRDQYRGGRFTARRGATGQVSSARNTSAKNDSTEQSQSYQQLSQPKQPSLDRSSNTDCQRSGIRGSRTPPPPPPPPPKPGQNQRDTRFSVHYGGAGDSSGKRDGGKLDLTGSSNDDGALFGKGNTGKGNINGGGGEDNRREDRSTGNMNAAPLGGVGGIGRGGWEPPQGSGSGRVRGGGRGGGRGRGTYRRFTTKRR